MNWGLPTKSNNYLLLKILNSIPVKILKLKGLVLMSFGLFLN